MEKYVYYACGENVKDIQFNNDYDAWKYVKEHLGYDCVVERRKEVYAIPSLKTIEAEYKEIVSLLNQLKTKKDVLDFEKKYNVLMEINSKFSQCYDEKEQIRYIRCEAWKNLKFIYVFFDNQYPLFSVWADYIDDCFIDETTIEKLEENYIKNLKSIIKNTSKYNINNLIKILRDIDIEYNDLIVIYGIDSQIVEAYEAENYELGYGDIDYSNYSNLIKNVSKEQEKLKYEFVKMQTEIIKNAKKRGCHNVVWHDCESKYQAILPEMKTLFESKGYLIKSSGYCNGDLQDSREIYW